MEYEPWVLWPKQLKICNILDKDRLIFWPKARQVGGSQIAAAKAIKCALEEPNAEIIIISKSEPDAKYFLADKIKPLLNTLPAIQGLNWGSWVLLSDKVTFSNGSTITCLTTSEDAGRGHSSVRLFIMDEAAAIEHAKSIFSAAKPSVEKHPKGQFIVISNSKPASWFNAQLKRAWEGKMLGATLHFMSVWTDPARNEVWRVEAMSQFENEIDFILEYPETIEEMFLKKEGYVWPEFEDKEGGRHVAAFEPDWSMRLMYGYDDGYIHPAVFLLGLYDPYQDHLYVFDELFEYQKDTNEISKSINKLLYKWRGVGMPHNAWKKIADYAIFAKKGQRTVSDIIRDYTGIVFSKSYKFDMTGSIRIMGMRIRDDKITIHPRCSNTIRQVRDLTWAKEANESKAERPIDNEDDAPDILRYWGAELKQEKKPKQPEPRKAYDGRFNKLRRKTLDDILGEGKNITEKSLNSWQSA